MRLRVWRAVFAAGSVLLGLGVVATVVWWLSAGEPVFPVVAPLAALSFIGAMWARRFDRRFAAAKGELPPGWDGVDLDVQTTRLRTLAVRATALAVVCALVAAAALAGTVAVLTQDTKAAGTGQPVEITAGLVLMVAPFALMGFVFSLVAAAGWRRRQRAVAETGWRAGTATVRKAGSGLPLVMVTLADGTELTTQASTSIRGAAHMADFPGTEVRVGGCDRWMVVLFPRGLFRGGPYAVPARTPKSNVPSAQPVEN
ncbi:hypothetical protein [Amycolatopsis sp. cmx-4-68]|uniref:hypothetical protein n=1 Tax=Amycolatopsis sp. cmx-4-68 TaxID=2790938 RepID=UPI00397D9BF0